MKAVADTVLMIRPVHFHYNRETAVNNYYQQEIIGMSMEDAQENAGKEFDQFVQTLQNAGIRVIVVPDTEGHDTPDSIFPNNWVSFHPNGAVVLYPMYAENRRKERRPDILEKLRNQYNYSITQILDLSHYEEAGKFFEGTGSIVLDRTASIAYAALSPRTDETILEEFCHAIGYSVVKFTAYQSVNGQRLPIYHTNVMMCVGGRFAVICADSIDDVGERSAVIASLEQSGKDVILISEDQVKQFAGNMLELGATDNVNRRLLVMSQAAYDALSAAQKSQLMKHAELVYSPLDTIEALGGGSARCMLAEVFLPEK